jgi:RecA-family ATPase
MINVIIGFSSKFGNKIRNMTDRVIVDLGIDFKSLESSSFVDMLNLIEKQRKIYTVLQYCIIQVTMMYFFQCLNIWTLNLMKQI